MHSKEDILKNHKKALKDLEQQKRIALKKAKNTAGKGKKGKEALSALEKEYSEKEKALKEKHANELAENLDDSPSVAENAITGDDKKKTEGDANPTQTLSQEKDTGKPKKTKAQRKREKAREKERQREIEIENEKKNAGPSPRDYEIQRMNELNNFKEKKLEIMEVPADGNCLYRAVASFGDESYKAIREICADTLLSNKDDFAPFIAAEQMMAEESQEQVSFEDYVDKVRSSCEWGGQLELRAIAIGLKRPIVVYSADSSPIVMGDEFSSSDIEEVRLTYHRSYYALGEHYNALVEKK